MVFLPIEIKKTFTKKQKTLKTGYLAFRVLVRRVSRFPMTKISQQKQKKPGSFVIRRVRCVIGFRA
jgi:radical SAM superfamily enzyme with C-terminal helix-hairpin-helix motif